MYMHELTIIEQSPSELRFDSCDLRCNVTICFNLNSHALLMVTLTTYSAHADHAPSHLVRSQQVQPAGAVAVQALGPAAALPEGLPQALAQQQWAFTQAAGLGSNPQGGLAPHQLAGFSAAATVIPAPQPLTATPLAVLSSQAAVAAANMGGMRSGGVGLQGVGPGGAGLPMGFGVSLGQQEGNGGAMGMQQQFSQQQLLQLQMALASAGQEGGVVELQHQVGSAAGSDGV